MISVPVIGAATTSGETFNQARVQTDLAKAIKAKSGYAVKVECPQNPPLNPGSKFTCIATAADGSTVPGNITIQDRSGDYLWQVGG